MGLRQDNKRAREVAVVRAEARCEDHYFSQILSLGRDEL